MKQNRFKSKLAWTAIILFVGCILKTYGLFTPLGLTPDSYKELTDLLMVVAGTLGVLNDPTNKTGF